jgi:NarL family two-component system response regulator LiaR
MASEQGALNVTEKPVIRVIIVDDHAIVRSGLANFLKAIDDLALVGETASGAEALKLCEALHPDVVMMDLVMPDMNGIEATRAIHARYPDLPVLILSSFGDEEMVREALQAGAMGYLLKNASIHDMARAIRAAYAGQPTLSPEATQALIRVHTRDQAVELKERELEVLKLLAKGLTNPQIAENLSLSVSTIKFYVSAILEKLNVDTRTEAAAWAIQHGLVSREP